MADSHTVPSSRLLKRPYYLLRTSDARNHYFRYEIVRAIFHSSDPIARFLPRGEVIGKPDARSYQAGEEPRLEYDLSDFELEDPRPLDCLTDSEIDAFAAAVDDFCCAQSRLAKSRVMSAICAMATVCPIRPRRRMLIGPTARRRIANC